MGIPTKTPTFTPHMRYTTNLLTRKSSADALPNQVIKAPPPIIVERDKQFEVECVEYSQVFRQQLQYLVKWRDDDERSWEPAMNVDRLKAIHEFHADQPGKPGS
jgi:hypothetical protein